jgi:hypothetical protein
VFCRRWTTRRLRRSRRRYIGARTEMLRNT